MGSHPSLVHGFPSLQSRLPLPAQVPPEQTSFRVQAEPSEQDAELKEYSQPTLGVQKSVVHTSESSQLVIPLPVQTPSAQPSPGVHAFPSSQVAVLGVCWQVPPGAQESFVQGFPSSQES